MGRTMPPSSAVETCVWRSEPTRRQIDDTRPPPRDASPVDRRIKEIFTLDDCDSESVEIPLVRISRVIRWDLSKWPSSTDNTFDAGALRSAPFNEINTGLKRAIALVGLEKRGVE